MMEHNNNPYGSVKCFFFYMYAIKIDLVSALLRNRSRTKTSDSDRISLNSYYTRPVTHFVRQACQTGDDGEQYCFSIAMGILPG